MIKFYVTRPQILTQTSIEKIKNTFLREVGELLFTEMFIATSASGPVSLGVKTGRLRKALRMNIINNTVEVYFDPRVAEHAIYALKGTRYIASRNILENVLQRVLGGPQFAQAKTKMMRSLGLN